MLKTITTVLILTTLALSDGSVLKTGQVKSYDQVGVVVTDGSVKDDGYYQTGKARSYGRSGDIVIDNAAGLQWQDDVGSVQKKWEDAGSFPAAEYCDALSLGGHTDWRLPSIQELLTLPDASQSGTCTARGVFEHISSDYYWSSIAYASSSPVWYVYFASGGSGPHDKNTNNYVRCVRGGELEPSNFSRNDEIDIVMDLTTGLQWQDDDAAITTKGNWITAIDYCENTLILGGYNDWRLPNRNELLSIVDYSKFNPAIYSVFVNKSSDYYWSSTNLVGIASYTWYVYFGAGYSGSYYKSSDYHVRCVRGGQFDTSALPSIMMYLLN